MEDTEEPPQSEESDVLVEKKKQRPTSVDPKKQQRPTSVDPKKQQRPVSVDPTKKQRPVSVDPKKKLVDDVPKVQPIQTSEDGTEDVVEDVACADKCCCGNVPWSRWEELIISYLHIVIAVSSGMAGAGLNTVIDRFEHTFAPQNSTTVPTAQNPTGNATSGCEVTGYLSDDLNIIVTTIYTVIIAAFVAQVITLIVMGAKRQYSHAKLVFTILRGLITLFTTAYFVIGWTGALGCVTLNYFAISTTVIEVIITGVGWYKEFLSLGKLFLKDFCPSALPSKEKKKAALNTM